MKKYDNKKQKSFEIVGKDSEHGRSTIDIECPFCGEVFIAYLWSLSGSGKKCPKCKAFHYSSGIAVPLISQDKNK